MRECEMEVYRIPAVKSGSPLGEIRLEKIQRWISIYISSDSTSDFYIFNTSADHSRRTFVELKEERNPRKYKIFFNKPGWEIPEFFYGLLQ